MPGPFRERARRRFIASVRSTGPPARPARRRRRRRREEIGEARIEHHDLRRLLQALQERLNQRRFLLLAQHFGDARRRVRQRRLHGRLDGFDLNDVIAERRFHRRADLDRASSRTRLCRTPAPFGRAGSSRARRLCLCCRDRSNTAWRPSSNGCPAFNAASTLSAVARSFTRMWRALICSGLSNAA